MAAGIYNILCEQGATFRLVFTWRNPSGTPVDLTGYTGEMDVRPHVQGNAELMSFSTAAGNMTLGGSAGTVTLALSATATSALAHGAYVYDLELTAPNNTVTRLVGGTFTVDEQVTR